MATEYKAQIGPVILLLVIAAAVLLYAISVPPVERERLLGPIFYERVALDVSPGEVQGTTPFTIQGMHDLAGIVVDFSPIPSPTVLSDQISVSRSLASDNSAAFNVNVNKGTLSAAALEFEVSSKEGELRGLLVTVNNTIVYNAIVPLGNARVTVPADQLADGPNLITISVAPPGFAFWRSSSYVIRDLQFVAEQFVETEATKQQTFTIGAQELDGLVSARYQALARIRSKEPAALRLDINGRRIFSDVPASNVSLNVDLPRSLIDASNTLVWNVDKGGAYEILFSRVVTTYSRERFQPKSYTFTVLQMEEPEIRASRYSCTLEAATQQAPGTLTAQINSKTRDFSIKDGKVTEDICKELQQGENFIALYSSANIQLDSVKVTIKGKV
ncbi:MAG TPA: hypothetical protein VJ110_03900 [Candidatus Nanoarchaeia archaeon]|nr:hypothetical protein [Candidatus Nanoarchaeia archaeon]